MRPALTGILLGVYRFVGLVCMCLWLLAAHGFMRLCGRKNWNAAQNFYGAVCTLFGLKARVIGQPASGGGTPVIYLSNHLSYLDVMVLGSLLPARFIAKSEVAHWPVFGPLCRLQNTVFIERTHAALQGMARVVAALVGQGLDVALFPEGTSTDGQSVKNFKHGLLEAFYSEGGRALVQPVAIVLEQVGGTPVEGRQDLRDIYAWWRPETTLIPHLWAVACTKNFNIAVHFLPPLDPAQFEGRKELGQAAYESVRAIVERNGALGYKAPTHQSNVPVAQLDRATVS